MKRGSSAASRRYKVNVLRQPQVHNHNGSAKLTRQASVLHCQQPYWTLAVTIATRLKCIAHRCTSLPPGQNHFTSLGWVDTPSTDRPLNPATRRCCCPSSSTGPHQSAQATSSQMVATPTLHHSERALGANPHHGSATHNHQLKQNLLHDTRSSN
jgi:hypothetical protein